MKQKQRKVIGYIALTIALTIVIGATTALVKMNANATAEAVTVAERATDVDNPFSQAVRSVKDSVVGVNNYGRVSSNNYFGGFGYGFGFGGGFDSAPDNRQEGREVLQGAGSGVVIASGYVLTNYHVVEGSTALEVTAGEKTYKAELMGSDETLDIAVLKAEGLDLKPVTIGDSSLLEVGDWAICIGNPLSFTGTTTVGIVSALNREVKDTTMDRYGRRTEIVKDMIQTDAAINSGNSGGGMFNIAGELVGIPSMKYTSSFYSGASVEGIGMAIPINAAKPLISDVLSGKSAGEVSAQSGNESGILPSDKPRIGVTVSTGMNETYNEAVSAGILPMGAYVVDVESGSPAEKAGLTVGDIIVDIDGNVITSTKQMVSILQAKEAGQTVAVKVYRVEGLDSVKRIEDIAEGQYVDLTVELAILDSVKQ